MNLPSFKLAAALALSAAAFSAGHGATAIGNANTNTYTTSLVPVTFSFTLTSPAPAAKVQPGTTESYPSSTNIGSLVFSDSYNVTNSHGVRISYNNTGATAVSTKFGNAEFIAALAKYGKLGSSTNPTGWSIQAQFGSMGPYLGTTFYAVNGSTKTNISSYIDAEFPSPISYSSSSAQSFDSNDQTIGATITGNYTYKGPAYFNVYVPTNSIGKPPGYELSGWVTGKSSPYSYSVVSPNQGISNGVSTNYLSLTVPGAFSGSGVGSYDDTNGNAATIEATWSFGASKAVIYTNSNIIQIP